MDEKKLVPPKIIVSSKPDRDNTLTMVLPDPQVDRVAFHHAGLRLHTMRQFLSGFSIAEDHDRSGLKYDVFLRHMLGVRSLSLGEMRLDFVRTTSAIFLVHENAAVLGALGDALPSLDTGRRYVLSDGKERMLLCRFTGKEFESIEAHAKEETDLSSLRRKLSKCDTIAADPGFDARAFSEGVKWAGSFSDNSDRFHYIIDHEDGNTYTLYVNLNPDGHEENPLVFVGKHGGETFYLYRVEIVI